MTTETFRDAAAAAMKIQPDPNVSRLQKAMTAVNEALPPRDPTLVEREPTHGDYLDTASYAQAIKMVLHSSPRWQSFPAWMKESLELIATKIARILAGDSKAREHWRDIVGYCKLVIERL